MVRSTSSPAPTETDGAPPDTGPSQMQALIELQQILMQMALAWQTACADAQREFWDTWTCRFAGGVPIDG